MLEEEKDVIDKTMVAHDALKKQKEFTWKYDIIKFGGNYYED